MSMIKTFEQFLLEQEETSDKKPTKSQDSQSSQKTSSSEEEKPEAESEPETKELLIGKTADGEKVHATMKLENTLKFSPEEFTKMQNMRTTQYERDMLTHMRGDKEYKVSKDKDGKFTIWHHNQTLHKLMPVGAFKLPERPEREEN